MNFAKSLYNKNLTTKAIKEQNELLKKIEDLEKKIIL